MVNNNGTQKNGTANTPVNGNGHKPVAIPGEHDSASSAGQALFWDGLSPAVTQALGQPLDPALVSRRKGRGGRSFDYLEGHVVIEQANQIFGYGGWGYEVVGEVTLRQVEEVDSESGEIKTGSAYTAPVRVTVAGALPRTDVGVHPVAEDSLDGHDTAIKGAVTDGIKRAFRSFGDRFGNGLYGDQAQDDGGPQKAKRDPAPPRAKSGQSQAQPKGRSDAQAEKLRKRLVEIASAQGLDEEQVRTAVADRTGKSIDDLTADELGPLVEAAANKLRQMQQAQTV